MQVTYLITVLIVCGCDLKERGVLRNAIGVVVVVYAMQLFCAFSPTKVWYFNAFIVQN